MKKITPEKTEKTSKICPVCGTRLSESATRCLVCGTQLTTTATPKSPSAGLQPKRLPEVRLKLPVAIGVGILFLALLAGLVILIITNGAQTTPGITQQDTPTPTLTPTATLTLTAPPTNTPVPTWTPLPPLDYTVKANEYCSDIAAVFGVSVISIIQQNNLNTDCTISEGMVLKVPQPTLTPSPVPTATVEAMVIDEDICTNTIPVTVEAGWTLSSIAMNYNVTMASIREFNNMPNDIVQQGQVIIVPLCERKPTAGPSPTPTPLPPYPAPNLLLPRSGDSFSATDNAVTLQWASVADLRENELYRVTIQDLTSLEEKILVEYVRDTKFILPSTFRPADASPHIIQWTVAVARQINPGEQNPIYEEAGKVSTSRVFSWIGTGVQTTPNP
ncbi:MAG TPA: LysM peptidoglycan-binding domain-containing protein [Anaerolineaceae bacterium]|nr:LysM peptidoglycan-binding domain-containing protein [Anaerolineaceae bacterium]HPT23095.1 LysM peptidoglycan-binding domain-containing protein [Anaerolineaceae bacterium]